MTSILASRPPTRLPATGDLSNVVPKAADCRILCFGFANLENYVRSRSSGCSTRRRARDSCVVFSGKLEDSDSAGGDDDSEREDSGNDPVNSDKLRENLERIVGRDDSSFSGIDLATLIRNRYGRSYDVQLIKKRSFPLTEEEYILRLDDVANTLKCWGAVSHIRSSLEKVKERPRIGKAVSIFIDMDESGGRANEWIYK